MFTHAPRFPQPKPSNVSGPNSYALPAVPDGALAGAFAKAERFRKGGRGEAEGATGSSSSDHSQPAKQSSSAAASSSAAPAAPTTAKRRVPTSAASSSSSHGTVSKREYEHLLSVNGKLEAKAAKVESRLREANVERARLKEEADTARREFRHKETALRAQLEQAGGNAPDASASRKRDAEMARRVDELRQIHKDDKAKWTAKIASLEADLQAAAGKADASKDRGRLVQARVEWDAEKLRLLGEVREEKQAARRAAKDKEAADAEAARLVALVEGLEGQLEDAIDAAATAEDEAETLRALLADASALYGRLASTSVDKALYDGVRARAAALELELATAAARLLPLRVSRQHQKDLAERVSTLELLLAEADDAGTALHAALRSVVDAPGVRMAVPDRVPTEPFDSGVTVDCFAVKASVDVLLTSHLSARLADVERQHRSLTVQAFDDELSAVAVADQLSTAVAGSSSLQARLTNAEGALAQLTAELKTTTAELAAVRSREADARAALATLEDAHAKGLTERAAVEKDLKGALRRADEALGAERDTIKRLASTVGQGKVAEEALRADLAKAERALADAQEFEAAYDSQLKENAVLAELTDLAEDEARALAAQNAEILGQNNLNQRILYLGKLRSELLDYKQHAVTLGFDVQALSRENASLRDELSSFKSLDLASKPPTALARVSRAPLAPARSAAVNSSASVRASASASAGGKRPAAAASSAAGKASAKRSIRDEGEGGRENARPPAAGEGESGDWTARGALTLEDLM